MFVLYLHRVRVIEGTFTVLFEGNSCNAADGLKFLIYSTVVMLMICIVNAIVRLVLKYLPLIIMLTFMEISSPSY